ncbi:MAG: hypothetical protein JW384_03818 [Nitrosomonadaceae bacterium]|nr:hypothetical protein [Nitrosomonadaceae bacterium]
MKKTFTDKIGKKWDVTIATKLVNNRQDIMSVKIEATGSNPISRRALASISLEELFGNDLAVLSPASSRILQQRKTTSRQGRAHSDEDLQTVADIYTAARKARIPVQRAVANTQGISVSTAAKRIMAARKAGMIKSSG